MAHFLPISVLVIFGAALVAPFIKRLLGGDKAGWLLALAPFTAFGLLLSQIGSVADGSPVVFEAEWFSALGTAFALKLDGFSLLMGLLVTGIGGFIVLYASGYLHGHPQLGRFFLYLLAFMGSMVGLVLSDNLLLLFIFWEGTSITSYLLIGFNHDEKESRWKALQALFVTGLGAMAMLCGFVLIAMVTGSYSLSEINQMGDILRDSPLYVAIVILLLGGAFTKSAQFPFHFWLPNAMAAPTPVSAYLHSATMVKAGVFLLARVTPGLGGTDLWFWALTVAGGVTLLLAVVLGVMQTDLKRILAYTTLAVLGFLTMLIGVGSPLAIKAMVLFLFAHALYKATLFMVAGAIDHETGTRDVRILGGLMKSMPLTFVAGGLAALSMCGFPPFFGFIGKEYVYKAGVELEGVLLVILGAGFVGNILMMSMALSVGVAPFWGREKEKGYLPKSPHEVPLSMWIGPICLGVLGIVFGLFPALVANPLVGPAIAAVEGSVLKSLELKLWHGVNLPLILSILTIAGGFFVFSARERFWDFGKGVLPFMRKYGAEAMYDRVYDFIIWFSKFQTRRLQTGYMHDYTFFISVTTVGFLLWSVWFYGLPSIEFEWLPLDVLMVGLVVLMIVAGFTSIVALNYVTVLVSLGIVGFGVALIFAYFGAPDLAITQLSVETLIVVLFMFVLIKLPPLRHLSGNMTRLRDGVVASLFGLLMTVLACKAIAINYAPAISGTMAELSYTEAKGKNIVNVILVDFRALDTMGEITVIAAAALGIAALVATRMKKGSEKS